MRIFRGHKAPSRGVAWLPDGSGFVSASRDGVIRVWDLASGQPRAEFQLSLRARFVPCQLECLAVSPTGGALAAGGSTVALWDLTTGQRTFLDPPVQIHAHRLAFSADARHLVAGLFWPVEDSGIRAWDTTTGQRVFPNCRVAGGVWALAAAPQDETVAIASPEGTVIVLDPVTGEHLWRWSPPWEGLAHALAFSPNGERLALASKQSVWLFDAKVGRLLTRWETHEKHHVTVLCFSPDGKLLATGANDRTVKFWDLRGSPDEPPPRCAAWDWQLGKVRAVAFAPDGMTAAAVGDNRKVVVWDVT
jgi:WD40 repeat protein